MTENEPLATPEPEAHDLQASPDPEPEIDALQKPPEAEKSEARQSIHQAEVSRKQTDQLDQSGPPPANRIDTRKVLIFLIYWIVACCFWFSWWAL